MQKLQAQFQAALENILTPLQAILGSVQSNVELELFEIRGLEKLQQVLQQVLQALEDSEVGVIIAHLICMRRNTYDYHTCTFPLGRTRS